MTTHNTRLWGLSGTVTFTWGPVGPSESGPEKHKEDAKPKWVGKEKAGEGRLDMEPDAGGQWALGDLLSR